MDVRKVEEEVRISLLAFAFVRQNHVMTALLKNSKLAKMYALRVLKALVDSLYEYDMRKLCIVRLQSFIEHRPSSRHGGL